MPYPYPTTPPIYQTTRVDAAIMDVNPVDLPVLYGVLDPSASSQSDAVSKSGVLIRSQAATHADQAAARQLVRVLSALENHVDDSIRSTLRLLTAFQSTADGMVRSLIGRQQTDSDTHADTSGKSVIRPQVQTIYRDIVVNGSFEQYPNSPGIPAGWHSDGVGTDNQYTRDTSVVFDSLNSLRITAEAGIASPRVVQELVTVPGVTYHLTGYVQPISGTNPLAGFDIYNRTTDVHLVQYTAVTGGWVRIDLEWTAAVGGVYALVAAFNKVTVGDEVAVFDKISITEVPLRKLVRSQTDNPAHLDALVRSYLPLPPTVAKSDADTGQKSYLPNPLTATASHADSAALRQLLRALIQNKSTIDSDVRNIVVAVLSQASHADSLVRSDLPSPITNAQADVDSTIQSRMPAPVTTADSHADSAAVRALIRQLTSFSQKSDLATDLRSVLVARWKMDDASGTVMSDSSGNGNDAALVGTYTLAQPGQIGNAIVLTPNARGSVNISQIFPTSPTAFSFETTFKLAALWNWSDIMRTSWVVGSGGIDLFVDSTGQCIFGLSQGGTQYNASGGPISAGSFVHIIGTWDGTTVRIYVNAAAPASGTGPVGWTLTPNASFNIGDGDNEIGAGAGNITQDETRIYSRALTQDEVTFLHTEWLAGRSSVTSSSESAVRSLLRTLLALETNADSQVRGILRAVSSSDAHADAALRSYLHAEGFSAAHADAILRSYLHTETFSQADADSIVRSLLGRFQTDQQQDAGTVVTSRLPAPLTTVDSHADDLAARQLIRQLAQADQHLDTVITSRLPQPQTQTIYRDVLVNGSFEQYPNSPGIPAGWHSDGAGTDNQYTRDTTVVLDGLYSLRITAEAGIASPRVVQELVTVPGVTYHLIGYVQPISGTNPLAGFDIYNRTTDVHVAQYTAVTGGWVKIELEWTATATGVYALVAAFNKVTVGDEVAVFDKVSITELPKRNLVRQLAQADQHADITGTSRLPLPLTTADQHADDPAARQVARILLQAYQNADATVRQAFRAMSNADSHADDTAARQLMALLQSLKDPAQDASARQLLRALLAQKTDLDADVRNIVAIVLFQDQYTDAIVRSIHYPTDASVQDVDSTVTSRLPLPVTTADSHADTAAARQLARQLTQADQHADAIVRGYIPTYTSTQSDADAIESRSILAPTLSSASHADSAALRQIVRAFLQAFTHADDSQRQILRVALQIATNSDTIARQLIAATQAVKDPAQDATIRQLVRQSTTNKTDADATVRSLQPTYSFAKTDADAAGPRSILRPPVAATTNADQDASRQQVRAFLQAYQNADTSQRQLLRTTLQLVTHADSSLRQLDAVGQSTKDPAQDDPAARQLVRQLLAQKTTLDADVRDIVALILVQAQHADALVRSTQRSTDASDTHADSAVTSRLPLPVTTADSHADDPAGRQVLRPPSASESHADSQVRSILVPMASADSHADVAAARQMVIDADASKSDTDSVVRSLQRVMSAFQADTDDQGRSIQRGFTNPFIEADSVASRQVVAARAPGQISNADDFSRAIMRILLTATVNLDVDARNILAQVIYAAQHTDGSARAVERTQTDSDTHADDPASHAFITARDPTQIVHTDVAVRQLIRLLLAQSNNLDVDTRLVYREMAAAFVHSDNPALRQFVTSETFPQALLDAISRSLIRATAYSQQAVDFAVRSLQHAASSPWATNDSNARQLIALGQATWQTADDSTRQVMRALLTDFLGLDVDFRFYPIYTLDTITNADAMIRAVEHQGQFGQQAMDDAVHALLRLTSSSKGSADDYARAIAGLTDILAKVTLDTDVRSIPATGQSAWTTTDDRLLSTLHAELAGIGHFDTMSRSISDAYQAFKQDLDIPAMRFMVHNGLVAAVTNDEALRSAIHTAAANASHDQQSVPAILRLGTNTFSDADQTALRSVLASTGLDMSLSDPTVARAVLTALSQATATGDEAVRGVIAAYLGGVAHAEGLLRAIQAAPIQPPVAHADDIQRALASMLTAVIQDQDSFEAFLLTLDPERVLCVLRAILFFLPMWEPKVYGQLLQDLVDRFESTGGMGKPTDYWRMVEDLFFFATQWMPEAYGALLADLPSALRPTPP